MDRLDSDENPNPKGLHDKPRAATAKLPAIRVQIPANSLEKQSTGQASYIAYGHRVAAVNVSRGGKEGNNAFTADAVAVSHAYAGEDECDANAAIRRSCIEAAGARADCNALFDNYFTYLMQKGSNPALIHEFAQAIDRSALHMKTRCWPSRLQWWPLPPPLQQLTAARSPA